MAVHLQLPKLGGPDPKCANLCTIASQDREAIQRVTRTTAINPSFPSNVQTAHNVLSLVAWLSIHWDIIKKKDHQVKQTQYIHRLWQCELLSHWFSPLLPKGSNIQNAWSHQWWNLKKNSGSFYTPTTVDYHSGLHKWASNAQSILVYHVILLTVAIFVLMEVMGCNPCTCCVRRNRTVSAVGKQKVLFTFWSD